jgi:inner membrane transporter RhtA
MSFSPLRPAGLPGSPAVAALALVAAMVSLHVGASFAKRLFPVVGIEGVTVLRLGFAALILVMVMRPWRVRFDAAVWPWLVAYGVAMGSMNLLFYMAIARLPLGVVVALMFVGPLGIALLSSRRALDFVWIEQRWRSRLPSFCWSPFWSRSSRARCRSRWRWSRSSVCRPEPSAS